MQFIDYNLSVVIHCVVNQCETSQFVLKPVHMKPLEFLVHIVSFLNVNN